MKYVLLINSKLSCINKTLLAFDGFNEERFAVMSKPAEENARSDAELVIGTAYTQHINLYKFGNDSFISVHHCKGSSTESDVCRYFLISIRIGSSEETGLVCFAANSNRNFLTPRS